MIPRVLLEIIARKVVMNNVFSFSNKTLQRKMQTLIQLPFFQKLATDKEFALICFFLGCYLLF